MAAIDALSAAQLAVDNRNYLLINRSRSLYGTALSQMMQAIQDPVMALKDETLLATYLLTLYEVNLFQHGDKNRSVDILYRSSLELQMAMASSTTSRGFSIC
jgi:hypothetical protein